VFFRKRTAPSIKTAQDTEEKKMKAEGGEVIIKSLLKRGRGGKGAGHNCQLQLGEKKKFQTGGVREWRRVRFSGYEEEGREFKEKANVTDSRGGEDGKTTHEWWSRQRVTIRNPKREGGGGVILEGGQGRMKGGRNSSRKKKK